MVLKVMIKKEIAIIEASIRLFARDGVSVPTSRIAKEASVSNGTLFNVFENKKNLFDSTYLYIKEKMAHDIMGGVDFNRDLQTVLLNIWASYISWATQHPLENKVVNLLQTSQVLSEYAHESTEHLFADIHAALQKGIADKAITDLPLQYICEIAAAHLGATISYAQSRDLVGSELNDLVQASFDLYWTGLVKIK